MAKQQLIPFNKTTDVSRTPFTNMLEDFFADSWLPFRQLDLDAFKLDVKEDDKAYTIEAEMPGADKKDISLNLENGRLTIGVETREKKDDKKKVHSERRYSYMERSIYLADAAEQGAEAKLENGELTITIPKVPKAAAASKQIEIK